MTSDELQRSPLWLLSGEPALHGLIAQLEEVRQRLETDPRGPHRLVFSRRALEEARGAFARLIHTGERRLHRLCALLGESLLRGRFELESVAVAEVETTGERFVLSQQIGAPELDRFTDLDLGNRQIARLRFQDGELFRPARLVANFVEYQPFETTPHGVFKLTSRIKAEEEIWNKVADELFGLDALVQRDKKLRRLSRYVKDVFGLKLVAVDRPRARRLHETLATLAFADEALTKVGLAPSEATRRLSFLEVKDYLGEGEAKKSGWSALKSVVTWAGGTFELQVQPLSNYLREREKLTRESHAGFKARREALRDEVARAHPLFGFSRDLLRWLFGAGEPPALPGVTVELRD